MRNFGYLETGPDDSETLYTKEAVQEAIKKVQLFGGLEVTGELNEETRNLLKSPRCGNKDVEINESQKLSRRQKRYVIGSSGWKKRKLRYQ
jgi:hypothetical protein